MQGHPMKFVSQWTGPGKLAPTLAEDLQLYDPCYPLPNGLNLLRDVPLNYPGYRNIAALLSGDSCRHLWCAKKYQENPPALDERPGLDSSYKFAGVCRRCRTHMDIIITYPGRWDGEICPNNSFLLHHFVPLPLRLDMANNSNGASSQGNEESISFECSSHICGATVKIHFRRPLLLAQQMEPLINREMLSRRTEEIILSDPSRFEGHKKPNPVDIMSYLRHYLKSSLDHTEPKPIRTDDKRFALKFGKDGQACKEILEYLKFTHNPDGFWVPPQADTEDAAPFTETTNIFLEDAMMELSILITHMPEDERRQIQDATYLPDAQAVLSRVLGSQNYQRHPSARTVTMDSATRDICFSALGSPQDASDELVQFAYRRQIYTNEKGAPAYLSFLHQIAEERRSELLETLVATEYSAGRFDADQLTKAYRYFSLPLNDNVVTDDLIIGTFQARLQDSAKHEGEMRKHLGLIGHYIGSQRIKDLADDALNNHEQALSFFGADPTTADEFFPLLYTDKTSEDPSLTNSARKAVQLIAQARGSQALESWLRTGELGETAMDVAEAYRQLNIDDRTIDLALIESAYGMALQDNPSLSKTYTKAYEAIVADRKDSPLQIPTHAQTVPDYGHPDWPVGLENIGNTCYLNSLLQFLFTIPELRNLVLHFDDARMELTPENVAKKKVGSRRITFREIQRAQRFVLKLKDLFVEMIRSPYQFVTPEQELTRLTLMTSTAAENIRRRSTIAGSRPLGTVNGLPIQGPLGPPPDEKSEGDDNQVDADRGESTYKGPPAAVEEARVSSAPSPTRGGGEGGGAGAGASDVQIDGPGDNSSEVTLVSSAGVDDSAMVGGLEAEQRSPNEDQGSSRSMNGEATDGSALGLKSVQSSFSDPSKHVICVAQDGGSAGGTDLNPSTGNDASPERPSRPPPIPPRPLATSQPDHSLEEYARQQDVTEVLNHVLFQLSCAIKPIAFDEEGEQVDQVKDLFYGKTKQHIIPEEKSETKNDRFCSIIVRLFSLPHDIYAALDGYFDVEEIANKRRYLSISRLPPIFQVQIDRAALDQKKNNHHVELRETIYLDRYLEADTNPQLMERRKDIWEWKRELAELEVRKSELTGDETHTDAQTAFLNAKAALMYYQDLFGDSAEGFEVLPSTIATLDSMAELTRLRLEDFTSRCRDLGSKINSQFADSQFGRHAYRLQAAFFHRGTASSGHYWIYIYDFAREMWLKYNDTRVEEVQDTNEIFRRPSEAEFSQWNGPANPYYLVYVRDQDKDRLVESVCRNVHVSDEVAKDVRMKDGIEAGTRMDMMPIASAPTTMEWPSVQSEHSDQAPLVLREKGRGDGEWDRSEANIVTKW